jgi:hypothetical protein
MMTLLSNSEEKPSTINPLYFQQVCGALFSGNHGAPMNGETQEDAYDFLKSLIDEVNNEEPDMKIGELFEVGFADEQICECGASKTFIDEDCHLSIPDKMHTEKHRVDLEFLFDNYNRDSSRFEDQECQRCGKSKKWSRPEEWEGKGLTKSPEFIVVQIPRGRLQRTGPFLERLERFKAVTKITPPAGGIKLPSKEGGSIAYQMVAMIEHEGQRLVHGCLMFH